MSERPIITLHLPLDVRLVGRLIREVTDEYPDAKARPGQPDGRVRDGRPEGTLEVVADDQE